MILRSRRPRFELAGDGRIREEVRVEHSDHEVCANEERPLPPDHFPTLVNHVAGPETPFRTVRTARLGRNCARFTSPFPRLDEVHFEKPASNVDQCVAYEGHPHQFTRRDGAKTSRSMRRIGGRPDVDCTTSLRWSPRCSGGSDAACRGGAERFPRRSGRVPIRCGNFDGTIAWPASVAWSLTDKIELLVLNRREESFVDASCSRVRFVRRLALGGPIVAAAIGPLLVLFAPYNIRCIGLSGLS